MKCLRVKKTKTYLSISIFFCLAVKLSSVFAAESITEPLKKSLCFEAGQAIEKGKKAKTPVLYLESPPKHASEHWAQTKVVSLHAQSCSFSVKGQSSGYRTSSYLSSKVPVVFE